MTSSPGGSTRLRSKIEPRVVSHRPASRSGAVVQPGRRRAARGVGLDRRGTARGFRRAHGGWIVSIAKIDWTDLGLFFGFLSFIL
jgi:hypothetical protein